MPPTPVYTIPEGEAIHHIRVVENGSYADAAAYNNAVNVIDAKAATLGYGPQNRAGDVVAVPGGYVGRYPNHDIYAAPGGPAFEVHGDIRAKYNALGGASGLLGIPTTDETGVADNVGRYNHFVGGSIYYTPHTGPMSVRGTVRDRWAAMGWEHSPLGYPVQDQHRMVTIPQNGPLVEWTRFENGVIAGDAKGGLDAPAASLTYDQLAALVGAQMNVQFQASPDNVALHQGIDKLGVADWRYDFWSSVGRSVGFRLHGFHDNGLWTDTDFAVNISLRFEMVWGPTLTEPASKTLVAFLDFLRVTYEGGSDVLAPTLPGNVVSGVTKAIHDAFNTPNAEHPEVPLGAIYVAQVPVNGDSRHSTIDILDVLVSAAGELQFFVNPLAPPGYVDTPPFQVNFGKVKQDQVQTFLNNFAEHG